VLGYIKQKIGLKLTLLFTGILCGAVAVVSLYQLSHQDNFNNLVTARNEQYVRAQALKMLSAVNAERAEKTEALLQKFSAYARLVARDVELRTRFAGDRHQMPTDVTKQMERYASNGIYYNPQSAVMMLCYWGGASIVPEIAEQLNLLAAVEPVLAEAKSSSPAVVASHLIMASGTAAYYPNGENVLSLPPVAVFDIRNSNNFVMANPVNNPEAEPLWVPVYHDDAGKGMVTSVTAPIYGAAGEFLGVAGLDLTIDGIRKLIFDEQESGESENVVAGELNMLLDDKGRIVSFPLGKLHVLGISSSHDQFRTAADVLEVDLGDSIYPEVRSLGEELMGSAELTARLPLGDQPYVVVARQLSTNGWQLLTIVPEKTIVTPVQAIANALASDFEDLGKQFYAIALLLLLVTLLIATFMLKRYFLIPIQRVTDAAQKIREGDLDVEITLNRTDELGSLAKTFNVMAENLRQGRLLEQNYMHELRSQVESQTAELRQQQSLLEQALHALHVDIERRQQVERELIEAKVKAEAANLAKANFLANMTHELRTPLIGVLGMNELLLDSSLPEHQRELAMTVQRSGENLLALVNDILDFSKLESGHLQLNTVVCSLAEVVEETVRVMEENASAKRLSLRCQIDSAARTQIYGDPLRLRQVVVNLVGNAIKFTSRGEVVARLMMTKQSDGKGHFVVEVRDSGIGMEQEDLQAIFAPFVQVDSTSTRAFAGTGLGLAIVRELVEAMQGTLAVESTPGSGSLFRVELDLPMVKTIDSEADKRVEPSIRNGTTFSGRILVVEDYEPTHTLIRAFLKGAGLEVEHARSASDALQLIEKNGYQLILMDCNMPDIDGIELTRRLRSSGNTTPIVAMTAHVDGRIIADSQAAGADAYLGKPFRRKDLLGILDNYL